MDEQLISNMDGRCASMVDELLNKDCEEDVSDGELPPLMNGKRPRGGRRARNRNKGDSTTTTPLGTPASSAVGVYSLHLTRVPFMQTADELAALLAPYLSTLFKGNVVVKEMISYRSKREKGDKGTTPTSHVVTAEEPSCNASLLYTGPPPAHLPVTVYLGDGKVSDTCTGEGPAFVIEQSSQTSVPFMGQPVITLYGKVYTLDTEPPAGKALSLVIAGITEISHEASSLMRCMSLMSTSRHAKMQRVHLTQVLIECATAPDAEYVKNAINEKKVEVKGQQHLFSVEYTSERQGDAKVNMAKPLYVSKEHRHRLSKDWPSDVLATREDSASKVTKIREAWLSESDLLAMKLPSPCSTTTAFTPTQPAQREHVPVLEFPSDPSDGIVSSQHSSGSVGHGSGSVGHGGGSVGHGSGCQDVATLVKAALGAVTSNVDLPWNQKAAVMMGAAAYAVVSGHYQQGATCDESLLNLVSQLNIPHPGANCPAAHTHSMPVPVPVPVPVQPVHMADGTPPSTQPLSNKVRSGQPHHRHNMHGTTPPSLRLPKYQRRDYYGPHHY